MGHAIVLVTQLRSSNWLHGCRRDVIQPLSQHGGIEGCRVIAFDRPPYGLSERPMTWPEGPEGNPYTSEASLHCAVSSPCVLTLFQFSIIVTILREHCTGAVKPRFCVFASRTLLLRAIKHFLIMQFSSMILLIDLQSLTGLVCSHPARSSLPSNMKSVV